MLPAVKILDVPQSGSIAGQTSSRNRFGQYRRTRAVPVNPNTTAQQTARNVLSGRSAAWRGLTDVQREAWENYAAEHPVTDSLGQTQVLTGMQAYVGVTSALLAAGLATITAPPAGAAPAAPVLTVDDGTAAAFDLTATPSPIPASQAMIIESSPPLSPGRSFNSDFRIIHVEAAAGEPEVTGSVLAAKFGTLAVGQKYFFRASVLKSTGERSAYGSVEVTLT